MILRSGTVRIIVQERIRRKNFCSAPEQSSVSAQEQRKVSAPEQSPRTVATSTVTGHVKPRWKLDYHASVGNYVPVYQHTDNKTILYNFSSAPEQRWVSAPEQRQSEKQFCCGVRSKIQRLFLIYQLLYSQHANNGWPCPC